LQTKLNRLVKTYASVIPRKDQNNIGIRLVKNKRSCTSTSSDSPNFESFKKRKNNYFDSSFLKRPNMIMFVKKPNYFDYTTKEIRKHEGESYQDR
jgi:hypothetical protein